MKAALHISLLILITLPQLVFAQESNRSNRISSKSVTIKGDSIQQSSEVIDVENLDHAMFILDSILNKNGIDFNNIQNIISEFEFDSENIGELGNMIESMFKDLTYETQKPSAAQKAVLGVVIDDYTRINDKNEVHPIISEVIKNSSAEKAGLEKNDIIYKMDDKEVHYIQDIFDVMKDKSEGEHLKIHYIRNQDTLEVTATLHACKKQTENWFSLFQDKMGDQDSCSHKKSKPFCEKIIIQKSGPRLGVKVTDLDAEARKSLKAKKGGAMITKVQPRSAAENMQLQMNDVITSINGHEILNIAELKNVVNHLPIPQEIQVKYIRYGKKKKAKGMITEFSKPWDDNEMMNIIDMSKFPSE